jgi:hypothetical protein
VANFVDVTIHDKDMGWIALTREAAKADNDYVSIGVHEEDDFRVARRHPKEAEIGNVEAAILNEYGATITDDDGTHTIPERSFLRQTLSVNSTRYMQLIGNLVDKVIQSKAKFTIKDALAQIGQRVKWDVKETIASGNRLSPPLSPKTIALRKHKGNEDIRPLFDSGQLIESIDYQVHSK